MTDLLFIVLLLVVGPSGTGKTDVAVQIIPTLTGCMDHTHTNWLFVQIIPTLTGCLYWCRWWDRRAQARLTSLFKSYPHWLAVCTDHTHTDWLSLWIIPTLNGCLYESYPHWLAVCTVAGGGTAGHRQDWRCRSDHLEHLPQLSRAENAHRHSLQPGRRWFCWWPALWNSVVRL